MINSSRRKNWPALRWGSRKQTMLMMIPSFQALLYSLAAHQAALINARMASVQSQAMIPSRQKNVLKMKQHFMIGTRKRFNLILVPNICGRKSAMPTACIKESKPNIRALQLSSKILSFRNGFVNVAFIDTTASQEFLCWSGWKPHFWRCCLWWREYQLPL